MGILRDFEHRLEGAVEGFFARVFRSGLQPVELAKALQRYASNYQQVGLDGVFVPNVLRFTLAPADLERFSGFAASLRKELAEVVVRTADEHGWRLRGPVRIELETGPDVRQGTYELRGKLETVAPKPAPTPAAPTPAAPTPAEPTPAAPTPAAPPTPVVSQAAPVVSQAAPVVSKPPPAAPAPAPAAAPVRVVEEQDPAARTTVLSRGPSAAVRIVEGPLVGTEFPLGTTAVLGRLPECDVTFDDPSVSRRHAKITHDGGSWTVEDLGSTNGVRVNGRGVITGSLADGDRLELGGVHLHFSSGSLNTRALPPAAT